MNENEQPERSGVSRRTVTKAMAWAVPVIAVAATVPGASASPPPPPQIDFGGACGNTGATQKGCGGDKTLQVPLTLTNLTGADYVFQIVSMFTCNCATAPTSAGSGVAVGVRGLFSTPNHTAHNLCTAVNQGTCAQLTPGGNIVVPNGTVNGTYWIESNSLGSSSSFSSTINWRIVDATTCAVLSSGQAQTAAAISPQNC